MFNFFKNKIGAGFRSREEGRWLYKTATIILLDDTVDTSVGDGVADITFTIPDELDGAFIESIHASVEVAGTTGTTDIQVHNVTDATDILSTKVTIDSGELTSYTAATAHVVNTSNRTVSTGDKLRFDVDAVSTTAAKGLTVIIKFNK